MKKSNLIEAYPERPIESPADDLLERKEFIERIASALVDLDTKAQSSRGVVIGLTGQWGTGKSSVLNLLALQLKEQGVHVVKFDPWIISGRDDLISRFITDLAISIGSSRDGTKLMDQLLGYAHALSPALELTGVPFLSVAGREFFGVAKRVRDEKKKNSARLTLHDRRDGIKSALETFGRPIVVLIDEIDRLDDPEIANVCQLVRSVADFPSVSYLLAYDDARVVEALSDGGKRDGRAFLEKIVQFSFPLPITLREEFESLLVAELAQMEAEKLLPNGWLEQENFQKLLSMLFDDVLVTPRDLKRVAGIFRVLRASTRGELLWVDAFGLSVLMARAPETVALLRSNPDWVLPELFRAWAHPKKDRQDVLRERVANLLKDIDAERLGGRESGFSRLLKFLFPILSGSENFADRDPDSITFRRPFFIAMRYGMIPGVVSRQDIEDFLGGDHASMELSLLNSFRGPEGQQFHDRLEQIYEPDNENAERFWVAVSGALRKPDCEWPQEYLPMHDHVRTFAQMFERKHIRSGADEVMARQLFELISELNEELATYLLRRHIFQHSLYNRSPSGDPRDTLLTVEETKQRSELASTSYVKRHLSSSVIPCYWSLQHLFIALDAGHWGDNCRSKLQRDIEDPAVADGLALMMFGGTYSTDVATIESIVGWKQLEDRVKRRKGEEGTSPSVDAAISKILDAG